jgi:hypothetical protein
MNWKSGIQTSKRTDSLIGLVGLFGLLALGTWLAANSPAATAPATTATTQNSFSSAEDFAHKNFLKMGYSCGSAKYHDDKKCGYSLAQPVAATAPAEITTTLPIVPTAGDMRLTVGAIVNFPPNVYNRDYFGCYDIENTKKGYRLYTTAVDAAAKKGVAQPELSGVAAVERFVWEHDIDHLPSNPNKPDFYTDACWAMKPFAKKDNAYLVRETAEWDGVGQVACLGPAISFSMDPKRPFCFWTILTMPPTLSR